MTERALSAFYSYRGLSCRYYALGFLLSVSYVRKGVRIRGTFGDIDRLKKVGFTRARSRVKKGPLQGASLIQP